MISGMRASRGWVRLIVALLRAMCAMAVRLQPAQNK